MLPRVRVNLNDRQLPWFPPGQIESIIGMNRIHFLNKTMGTEAHAFLGSHDSHACEKVLKTNSRHILSLAVYRQFAKTKHFLINLIILLIFLNPQLLLLLLFYDRLF